MHTGAEWVMAPLDALGKGVSLAIITVVTGGIALFVVKLTTNQHALVRSRQKMVAALYEMRLFLDAPARVVRAQVRLVLWSFAYTAQTLPGLVILTVPLGLVFLHLDLRHGFAPHEVGEQVLFGIATADAATAKDVSIEPPEGLSIAAGPVVASREGRVYYRLQIDKPGRHAVVVRAGDTSEQKLVVAEPGAVSLERVQGIENAWAPSSEAALDGEGPFSRIWVEHDTAEYVLLGIPWWAFWLVGSVVAALLLRRPLKAEI